MPPGPRLIELADAAIAALLVSPGSKTADIAAQVGADKVAMRDTLMHLEQVGRVRREGVTRATRWFLATRTAGSAASPQQSAPSSPELPKRAAGTPRRGTRESVLIGYADLMGKIPDAELAARAGVSREAVRLHRVRKGIPSARKAAPPAGMPVAKRTETADAPVVASAVTRDDAPVHRPAVGVAAMCWKVDFTGMESAYVVADSLVEAARIAMGAGPVVAVHAMGPAIPRVQ